MATQSLLVIDDDPDIQGLLVAKLTLAGYDVVSAYSAEQALGIIETRGLPHLAIVDIHMPGMGGLAFCERVQQFSDLPIIILTAEDDSEVVIRAIEQYAEDYVVKPFNLRELEVRVRRVLRRIQQFDYAMAPVLQIDDRLAINFGQQVIEVDGRPVNLTRTESKLLYLLLRNSGRVVSLEFLLNRLWPREDVYEDTLRVHIHRLRQKMDDGAGGESYIITERGQGYRFQAAKREGNVVM